MTAITPAASVLLRNQRGYPAVFMVRRSPALKFFGGFCAFPGGRLDPDDLAIAGVTEPTIEALRVTACRELFEETGVLITRPVVNSDDERDQLRGDLLAGRLTFRTMLADRGLTIDADDFRPIGVLTTPPFSPVRFATQFFTTFLPPGQDAKIWLGELDAGSWLHIPGQLASWRAGHQLLTPPTLVILQALDTGPIEEAMQRLPAVLRQHASAPVPEIFFAPDVQAIPLRTRALPPATHTNAFLVGGLLIDPGADDPAEQQLLLDVLQARRQPISAIVLTHHHPDHVGAAVVCAQQTGAPIYAHPLTAERLAGKVAVDRLLHDGEHIGLQSALRVIHTPGHAPGHIALYEPEQRLLFAGDMVSTQTSIVIAPPDGDLAAYLDSLCRLRALPARLLLPAHGNVSAQPQRVLDEALAHRAKREAQLLEALAAGPASIDELTPVLYRGTPEVLWRFARAQLHAGLIKLQREGRARLGEGERWEPVM